jgi:hypothetical protein
MLMVLKTFSTTVHQRLMLIRLTAITMASVMFVIPAPMILTTISMLTESVVILTTVQQFQIQARLI